MVWAICDVAVADPLDLDDRLDRVDDAEVGDRVDLGRHVVARDHVLGRDLEGDRAQVDAHHAVDERDEQHDARPLRADEAAEAEDDGALVLAQDADRGAGGGDRERDDDDDARRGPRSRVDLPLLGAADGEDEAVDPLDDDRVADREVVLQARPGAPQRAVDEDLAERRRRAADDADVADEALDAGLRPASVRR